MWVISALLAVTVCYWAVNGCQATSVTTGYNVLTTVGEEFLSFTIDDGEFESNWPAFNFR